MAKLNVEVEVDWLDESESLDDVIKSEVLHKVSKMIEDRLTAKALEKFESKVVECAEQIETRVVELSNKVIDDFVLTQRFPQPKNSYDDNPETKTIQEIFISKLDSCLTRSVDENGNYTTSSYSSKGTRLEWLTGKLAEKYADELVKKHVKDVKGHIEKYILDKVKGEILVQLSDSVLSKIDFSKIK
ncbi:hypothetical protein CLHUN_01560 [Ruminiclostridium hungatei]|uniref:Uncharacterized protein n=1 Tax=Ruminiclostridium hungatei TaxID=48256 RepID=A0A1V4SR37_RUMHU|nr:hypothetical protein [Ruminiclostridium hungatei]OPX46340.1 hypothetical protein CLHUN_01560 [Ruminiclostridium hungatei]